MKSWLRLVYLLAGMALLTLGVLLGPALFRSSTGNLPVIVPGLFFLGLGIYMLAWVARARLVIDGARIEVRDAFRERSAELSGIEGFRTIRSRNGNYTQLQLRQGMGTISIPQSFDTDDAYRAWMQRLTDLDQRDREEILAEVSRNEALGTTPEERLQALPTARTWALFLSLVTGVAAAGLAFGPTPLRIPAAVVVALAPLAAVGLLYRAPLLYAVFKQKADPRAELSFVPLLAGFGLLIRMGGMHFASAQPLLAVAVPLGLAYAAALAGAARNGGSRPGSWIAVVFFAGLYSYPLAVTVDTLGDHGATGNYAVQVLGMHVSRGRSTSYYLRLAPWGSVATSDQVSVSAATYNAVQPGDEVCVQVHPGNLHVPWYRVAACGTRFPEDAQQ
jgi:heme-degrading monooxygenase HmoA